jgi:hypothetical protein
MEPFLPVKWNIQKGCGAGNLPLETVTSRAIVHSWIQVNVLFENTPSRHFPTERSFV